MISLCDVPLSGDKLTDWIFKQFIFFLRRETLHITRRKRLLNPNDPHRHAIRGLMDPNFKPKIEITINSSKSVHANRNEEVKTLIHELGHVVFLKTSEHFILQIENILFEKFTQKQINLLKSFLPRHEVRK